MTTDAAGDDTMKTMNYLFEVPDAKKVRMIVHTDCANEADDQFALAHHLMTPKFLVKGIIGAHFHMASEYRGIADTVGASVNEIRKILKLMDLEEQYPVFRGAELPLESETEPRPSDGAEFIIQEALREDPHPLYIACQGSLTDIASAILTEPEICSRITVIWIGGGDRPRGGEEFNLMQDIAAANVVMKSEAAVWQVPKTVYKQMAVSLAELQANVYPCGELGKYLFTQMVELNKQLAAIPHWPHGEIWGLGDSPTIGLLLAESEKDDLYDVLPAHPFRYEDMTYDESVSCRPIRVYKDANARLTLADFFAKLRINYPAES